MDRYLRLFTVSGLLVLVNMDTGVTPLIAVLGQRLQFDVLDLLYFLRNGVRFLEDCSQLLLHGIR